MKGINFSEIKERFWTFWDNFLKRVDEEGSADYSREKIVVFFVAIILALCLWFLVNLSRAYVLNINLPLELGNIPEERALAEELPDFVTVSVQGEGWKLINLYNNPPRIFVDVTGGEVNLYDQVQQQMNAIPDIGVQKVQPIVLNLDLQEKVSKSVPVRSKVSVRFSDQYNFIEPPVITPDSITITGANSILNDITVWETDSVMIDNVRDDISREVELKAPGDLVSLSRSSVQFQGDVEEFTEGESRVFIRTRNLPQGQNITFSPAFVTVRYTVPIDEYTGVEKLSPFTASVSYETIRQDSTGFITPHIEVPTDRYHIRIQSHQPGKVAYYEVVDS